MQIDIDKDYALWGLGVCGVIVLAVCKLITKGFTTYLSEARTKIETDIEDARSECEQSIATLENECLDRDLACQVRTDKTEAVHKALWEGVGRCVSKEYMYQDINPKLDKLASQLERLVRTCVTKDDFTHAIDVINKRIDGKQDK